MLSLSCPRGGREDRSFVLVVRLMLRRKLGDTKRYLRNPIFIAKIQKSTVGPAFLQDRRRSSGLRYFDNVIPASPQAEGGEAQARNPQPCGQRQQRGLRAISVGDFAHPPADGDEQERDDKALRAEDRRAPLRADVAVDG